MADEAEIIKVAFQGSEMCLRTCGTATKEALKFLKFLVCVIPNIFRWNHESKEKKFRKKISKAEWKEIKRQKMKLKDGEVSLGEMMERYKNTELTLLSIPESSAERFAELAKKYNLHYSILPDLNVEDGVFQVMVPAVQADLYNTILQTLVREEQQEKEVTAAYVEEEIRRTREEKIKAATEKKQMEQEGTDRKDPEHYKEVCGTIDACDRRMADLEEELETLGHMESKEITYEDYMNTNQQAMNHQDLFMDLKEQGVALAGTERVSGFVKMPGREESVESQSQNRQTGRAISFEEAVTDVTARKEIKEPVFVCDRNHPENYMEVTARLENMEDRSYINTEFKVFHNGEEQRCEEFSHGKFTHYSDRNAKNSSPAGDEHWKNMQKEMKEKGGFGAQLLLFESKEEYNKFLEQNASPPEVSILPGDQYLTNPSMPDLGIRRDKVLDEHGTVTAHRYTLMKDGADTKVTLDLGNTTPEESRLLFLRHVNEEIRREYPEADVREAWMVLGDTEDFNIYQESVKKNVRSDKENLKEEFQSALGENGEPLKQQMNRESRVQAEQEKKQTVLKVPSQSILTLKRNKKGNPADDVLLYSADLSYSIKIEKKDVHKIKKDMDGTSLILLEEGESLKAVDRYSKREIGTITSQNELSDFLENRGKYPAKQGSVPLQKQKGGGQYSAKTQKHST